MAQYRNKRKDHVYKINDYLLGKLPGEDFSHHRLWNCPILGEVEHVKDLGNDGIINHNFWYNQRSRERDF